MAKRGFKIFEKEIIKEEKLIFHFIRRGLIGIGVILLFLAIGSSFYIAVEKMPIYDAIYHASMIMTGMGPALVLMTPAAKIFTSIYAMFSVGIIISAIIFIFEPLFKRWHKRTYEQFHKKK